MGITLSFIVPIYNVRQYLIKCVESLISQDFDNYEIILVDDGSTDGSGELAEKLILQLNNQSFVNISIIHQENVGLSAARNVGLLHARGTYVCFVDSDDYWHTNVLGQLMEQIKRENLDVLRFRWQNVDDNGVAFSPYKETCNYNNFSTEPITGIRYLEERMGVQCYAWQFIVRKELIEDCLFTEGILFEDTDWTPRMLLKANRVAGTSLMVYNYFWRQNSITLNRSYLKLQKEIDDKLFVLNGLVSIYQQNHLLWAQTMISHLVVSVFGILSTALYHKRYCYLSQLNNMHVFPLSSYHVGDRTRRKIKIINLSPRLALFLLHIKSLF